MTSVQAMGGFGFPNPYQVTANPTGAASTNLNADHYKDFGLGMPPVYNLPMDVNMGFGGMQGGMMGGMMDPMMMQMGMMNPMMMQSMMMSPRYREYINMDFKERLTYDADLRNAARETEYTEGKSAKNYASANDGLAASIRESCLSLQTVVIEGESDQIVKQFEGIVDMMKRSPLYVRLQGEFKNDPEALEKTIRNCARDQFQATTGQDLKAMIQENCDHTLANSFFNTISFGNAQTYSAEDIVAKMEGSNTPKSQKTRKLFGKIGGVTAGVGVGAAAGAAVLGVPGAIGGAVIGGLASIFSAIST